MSAQGAKPLFSSPGLYLKPHQITVVCMFLSEKQASRLRIPLHFEVRLVRIPFLQVARPEFGTSSAASCSRNQGQSRGTLRNLIDLALDRQLAMRMNDARRLQEALNRNLPPVWPGESLIAFEFQPTELRHYYQVVVPNSFHNRLHRFPFIEGFLVCPVPECNKTPSLHGTVCGTSNVGEGASCLIEYSCGIGHHWQCALRNSEGVTCVDVVRLASNQSRGG
jgi:hypothetical protein